MKTKLSVCACAPLPRTNPPRRVPAVLPSAANRITPKELAQLRKDHFVRIMLRSLPARHPERTKAFVETVWAQIKQVNAKTIDVTLRNAPLSAKELKWGQTVRVSIAALVPLHSLPRAKSKYVNDFAAT